MGEGFGLPNQPSGVEKWVGVDFDETLCDAEGNPIRVMRNLVVRWLTAGIPVRIVTARVNTIDHSAEEIAAQTLFVKEWCLRHIGVELPVQSQKSSGMLELWDDKVVRFNTNPWEHRHIRSLRMLAERERKSG